MERSSAISSATASPTTTTKQGVPPSTRSAKPRLDGIYAGVVFVGIACSVLLVLGLSVAFLPMARTPGAWRIFPHNPWLDGYVRWDAGWYRTIASQGYSYQAHGQSSVAFFPGYPTLARLAAPFVGGPERAGIAITFVSGLVAALLFHRWCAQRMSTAASKIAVWVLLLYPFAFYLFGPVYADATFLAAVLGAFVLLDADHPVWAGLVGAVATATRPIGIIVTIGLVLRMIERRGLIRFPVRSSATTDGTERRARRPSLNFRELRWTDAGVLISAGGLVAYCLLLWRRFGHPFAFITAQEAWGQAPGPATWLKFEVVRAFRRPALDVEHIRMAAPAIFCVVAIALLPAVVRRFGWAYATYAGLVVLIPGLSSGDFTGVGRYLLAAFPFFAAAGDLAARRPRLAVPGLALSGAVMWFFASLYGRWYYIS